VADTCLDDAGVTRGTEPKARDRLGSSDEYAHLTPLFKELADLRPDDPRRAALRVELVEGYLPVARHIARRFAGRGEPEDDLVQAGTVGLIGAVDRFDPHRGLDFLSFAVPTITGEIRRHFRDHTWAMRVPRRLKDIQSTMNAAIGPLTQELGRAPRPSEIAARLGVPVVDVVEGLTAQHAYRNDSLDQLTESGDSPMAKGGPAIDAAIEGVEDRETLAPLLDALPERERSILILRFFGNRTQSQIAEVVGVSQMHVSRLLDRTLRELREQFTR
jgi:RNA polymerase sigma-B factor